MSCGQEKEAGNDSRMVDLKKIGSSLEELLNSILYFYYLRNYGEFGLCSFFF